MNVVLQTPRLRIRPFTRKDTDAIFAIYSDENTNTFLPWFPVRTKYCYSYEEFWRPKNFPVLFRLYQISFGDTSVWRGYWETADRRFVESLP